MGDDGAQALQHIEAGKAALRAGDYAAAREALEAGLSLLQNQPGSYQSEIADAHNQLGRIYLETGDHAQGRLHFEKALAIRQLLYGPDHPEVASSLNNLGIQLKEEGDFAAARRCHEQALAIRLRVLGPNDGMVGYSYSNIGTLARNLGDYVGAKNSFEKALPILQSAYGAEHFSVAACLSNLGNVLTHIGDFPAALHCHEQALALRRKSRGEAHPEIANALMNLGFTLIESGDARAARPIFEQALAMMRASLGETNADVGYCLTNLGAAAEAMGDRAAARLYQEQALAMRLGLLGADHPDTGFTLLCLADLDRQEMALDQARAHLRRALRVAGLADGAALRRSVWHGLSQVEAAAGQHDTAIFFGKQAVNAIQMMRRALDREAGDMQRSYATAHELLFRHLADQLVITGRLAEAERVIGLLKEDELFELLQRDDKSNQRVSFVALTSLEAIWQRHGDDIIALIANAPTSTARETARAAFDDWLDAARQSFADASESHGREASALNRAARERLQSALAAIGPDVGLVHYLPGATHLTIILTTASLQIGRSIEIGATTLNRLIYEMRFAAEQRSDDLPLVAQQLDRILVAPIAEFIGPDRLQTLMLAPVGALRYLPFAALHDGRHYVVERVALSLYTAAAADALHYRATTGWRIAAFGVAREIDGHAKLNMVAEELARIVQDEDAGTQGLFPGRIHLDALFTAAHFAAALTSHDAVHIASHFHFSPGHESLSRLLLGDGNILTLEGLRDPIFQFDDIELITLSACETAMGGGRENGREIEGFGALVQNRGARAVLASLWSVSDRSTPDLMEAFYRARRDGASKAHALQMAQCAQIAKKDGTHEPFHWAAFILMGDWL
jgi:CHAT domain-containing protein/Tfp pilus assembly protein PilF